MKLDKNYLSKACIFTKDDILLLSRKDTAKIAVPQALILLLSQAPSFQKAHNLNLAAPEGYE